jgi:replication factor A1
MNEMKIESYITKIVEDTGLNRKEIQDLVSQKKEELKGLISEEGALFIIAKELGVDVKAENKDLMGDLDINISDITKEMKNVTLVGRIKDILRVYEFNRKEGDKGYVGSFLLNDNTGDMRIVLWDEDVAIFQNADFAKGEIVKIINGYPKIGRDGLVEIHIGRLGKVIISPEDVDYKKYPKIEDENIPINEITSNLLSVSIEGKVMSKFPIKEFTKKNGEVGKICSIIIRDTSGKIRVNFWNDIVERVKDFEVGDVIFLRNVKPRESTYRPNTIELNANVYTQTGKLDKKLTFKTEKVDKIKNLQDKEDLISFEGVVTSIDDLKEVTTKTGDQISLLSFIISDDTDAIRVTAWSDSADNIVQKLNMGDAYELKNVLIKYNSYSRRKEITYAENSTIKKVDIEFSELKSLKPYNRGEGEKFSREFTKIEEINSPGFYEIKGFIAKPITNITIYEACSKCFKKIDNCICDEQSDTEFRMIISLIIDDESGTIRATFIGDNAEKVINMKTDLVMKIRETPDYEKFLEKISEELVGKDIYVKGKARFSDYSGSYEIMANDMKAIDLSRELEDKLKEIAT